MQQDSTVSRKLLMHFPIARVLLDTNATAGPPSDRAQTCVPAQLRQGRLAFGPLLFSNSGNITLVLQLPPQEVATQLSFSVTVDPVRAQLCLCSAALSACRRPWHALARGGSNATVSASL